MKKYLKNKTIIILLIMIIIVLFGAPIIIKFLMETPAPFEFMEIVTRDTYEAWIGYYATEKECLREVEARIRKSLMLNKAPITDDKMTINDFWERYISMKCEIAESTLVSYIYLYNHHVRNAIGKRRIRTVKYSEMKRFLHRED